MHEKNNIEEYIDDINIPHDLENKWMGGIKRAQKEEGEFKMKKILKRSGMVAAGLILAVTIGAVASPTFADGIGKLLFGKTAFELSADKDLQKSMNEGVGIKNIKSVEKHGIELRITDAFLDSSNCFVVYEIEGSKEEIMDNRYDLNIKNDGFKYKEGNLIRLRKIIGSGGNDIEIHGERAVKKGFYKINADIEENRALIMELDITREHNSSGEKTDVMKGVEVEIPKMVIKEEVYSIGKVFHVSGEEILVDSLIVSPLRSSLVLKWKEDVSFNNLRVDNVLLKDSKGNQWNNISGEQVNLFNESENIEGIQIDMESVFYDNPQELYLDSIVLAVDDKCAVPVEINVIEKTIEKPHDEYLDFLDVKLEDDDIVLSFGFEYDPELDKIIDFNRIKGVKLSIDYPYNDHIGPFKEFNQKMDTTYEDGKGKSVIRFPQKDLQETMTLMVKHQLEEAKEYDLNIKIK